MRFCVSSSRLMLSTLWRTWSILRGWLRLRGGARDGGLRVQADLRDELPVELPERLRLRRRHGEIGGVRVRELGRYRFDARNGIDGNRGHHDVFLRRGTVRLCVHRKNVANSNRVYAGGKRQRVRARAGDRRARRLQRRHAHVRRKHLEQGVSRAVVVRAERVRLFCWTL